MSDSLPEPRLILVYRLEATLGEPLELGETREEGRRIVPQTGGRFSGPETAAPELDWMNRGVFISVGGRQPHAVIYETHLVA